MPEAPIVLDRAARAIRIVFALGSFFVLGASLLVGHGNAGNDGGWSLVPGRRLYVVTSGSMAPAVRVGDAVVVRPVKASDARVLRPGEVVTFRAANNAEFLITHRITSTRTSAGGQIFYETKGDANPTPDSSTLEPDRIVGVVTTVIPRLGSILVAIRSPRVLIAFLTAFLLLELAVLAFRTAGRTSSHQPFSS